mmetsp:Transcript_51706/g.83896  ORF Transcript_51706/g.83896 Transcript_51706/m.83896 type:complete len:214 (-) Transcript_51706:35-676(-)
MKGKPQASDRFGPQTSLVKLCLFSQALTSSLRCRSAAACTSSCSSCWARSSSACCCAAAALWRASSACLSALSLATTASPSACFWASTRPRSSCSRARRACSAAAATAWTSEARWAPRGDICLHCVHSSIVLSASSLSAAPTTSRLPSYISTKRPSPASQRETGLSCSASIGRLMRTVSAAASCAVHMALQENRFAIAGRERLKGDVLVAERT